MDKTIFNRMTRWLASDRQVASTLRGAALYAALGLLALAFIGVVFSETYAGFVRFAPLAILGIVGVLYFQVAAGVINYKTWIRLLGFGAVVAYVLLGILNAYVSARIYNGSQYDGAFQLYFPLRRMDGGEWPGRDFFYFHGQLIPAIVYPLFKILGSDFFAAQLAAKLVDLALPLAYFFIFRWLGLGKGRSLLATLLLVGLLVTNRFTFGTQNPIDGIHIYALRSAIPLLYLAYISVRLGDDRYLNNFAGLFYRKIVLVQALVFTLAFYLGGEQAFYLLGAMILANMIGAGARPLRWLLMGLCLVTLSVLILMAANAVLFGSQKPLLYLAETSQNQTWFYGSYPNEFLHSPLDFSRYRSSTFKASAKFMVCVIGLPVLLGMTWRLRSSLGRPLFIYTLTAGAYGLVGLTSLLASYAGEQYADNAIKVMLIVGIVLLVQSSFWKVRLSTNSRTSRVIKDLLSASPLVLIVALIGSLTATLVALNPASNLRLAKYIGNPILMSQPDLGVQLPYYPLSLAPDQRFHASQFLALAHAQGDSAARVIYPEFTYAHGFEEGIKVLFEVRATQAIPDALAIGDFCLFGSEERRVTAIDRQGLKLYFDSPTQVRGDSRSSHIDCYRKQAQRYMAFHGQTLRLEQNIFDRYFHGGLFRSSSLQVRFRADERNKIRPGDEITLDGARYRIEEAHANGVAVLDSAASPLPFAFERGASHQLRLHVNTGNSFALRLRVAYTESAVTQVIINDHRVLAEIEDHNQLFVARTNQAAEIIDVDFERAIVTLAGALDPEQLAYGLHLGELDLSRFETVGEIPPVFQLMKGILSAKTFESGAAGSNIDFYFHTFSTRLLEDYLRGFQAADPEWVTVPSGRHVNNFIWYDNWLVRARWPVFEQLLTHYDPVGWSKFESFWAKGDTQVSTADWQEVYLDGQREFVLPTKGAVADSGVCQVTGYVVEMDYLISGWQKSLPLIGASTRHAALIDDSLGVPLTFNPNEQRVRFPVFPTGEGTRIQIKSIAPFGVDTRIEVTSVRFRRLDLPTERLAAVAGRSADSVCL
ncbi:hypothetical protein [Stutzerimonas tarimensis]|uniref:Transmembrane protein n=1 Tax=Stutzerimonas tarimensis TaxID=1507735 RepID=A0ABV7TAN1_9GAMM